MSSSKVDQAYRELAKAILKEFPEAKNDPIVQKWLGD